MPITDLAIKAAQPGTMLWDDVLKGFGVRCGKSAKTFIVLIGKGRRQKLGRYPLTSLSDARTDAKHILAERHLGRVKPTHKAWEDAVDDFLKEKERSTRAQTKNYYDKRLNRHFKFGRKSVGDITPRDIAKRLNELNEQPAEKRHAFVVARTFLNWCLEQHIIDRSPIEHMSGPALIKPRKRILTNEEIKAVWHKAADHPFGTIVRVLILTGIRKGETQHVSLKGDILHISGDYTKNRREHVLPVGEMAKELLAKDLAFNGWSKSKARLDKAAPIPDWTLHDLRRTFATVHGEIGTPPHIVERLLNHVTGTMTPLARVYNQYPYIDEMREAMLSYEKHIATIVGARASLST